VRDALGHALSAAFQPPPAIARGGGRAFTPRQRHGIRKIGRKFGYPYDQRWDFVHETWLKVHYGWLHVPRVEPSMTRYIFPIARNLAIDLFHRFEEDAMTGPEIAADVGKPAGRIYKRVSRLVERLPSLDEDEPATLFWRRGGVAAWRFLPQRAQSTNALRRDGIRWAAVSRDVTSRGVGPRKGEACKPVLDSTSTAVR
jgi:hypothetical protein